MSTDTVEHSRAFGEESIKIKPLPLSRNKIQSERIKTGKRDDHIPDLSDHTEVRRSSFEIKKARGGECQNKSCNQKILKDSLETDALLQCSLEQTPEFKRSSQEPENAEQKLSRTRTVKWASPLVSAVSESNLEQGWVRTLQTEGSNTSGCKTPTASTQGVAEETYTPNEEKTSQEAQEQIEKPIEEPCH